MTPSAANRVFRINSASLWVGLLFGGMPLLMAVSTLSGWAENGIVVNGVARRDLGALLLLLCFLSIFIVIGAVFLLYYRNERVEVDSSEISIYDFRGRSRLKMNWREATGYRKVQEKKGIIPKATDKWTLESGSLSYPIPNVHRMGDLQAVIVRNLPPGVLVGEARKEVVASLPEHIKSSLKSGRGLYAMFFSAIWYGFLSFFLFGMFFLDTSRAQRDVFTTLVMIFGVLLFAAIPFDMFREAWLKHLRGWVKADDNRIVSFDGRHETALPWAEVKLVERSVVDLGESGRMGRLMIVSADGAIILDDGFKAFDQVTSLAFAKAPATAALFY